jgi:phage shock protein A
MLTGTSATSSLGALERMEEKLLQIEAQSEVASTLGGDDLEKRFASLDSYNDVDTELATMKTYMLDQGENPQPIKNLPKTPEL